MNTDTLILSAGKINFLHLPISESTSNAMVPVNGKPAIAWILEDLLDKGIDAVKIVMREEDKKLNTFLSSVFDQHLKIERVFISESKSILDSLKAGLDLCNGQKLRLLLGDTLISDSMAVDDDFIYIQDAPDSHRWCLATLGEGNIVTGYKDKEFSVPKPHHAVCGFYAFTDLYALKVALDASLKAGDSQLSDMLLRYQQERPIKAKEVKRWFDFGNIDNLIRSRQLLLRSRYFNSLEVDPILNTITKVSEFDEKLRRELLWFESLPEELQVLCPRIISKREHEGKLHLKQEYYGYPTLAELYMFSDLDVDDWESIIHRLLQLHLQFKKVESSIRAEDAKAVYLTKTWERLEEMEEKGGEWHRWLAEGQTLSINGKTYYSLNTLRTWMNAQIEKLIDNVRGCIIHGDYCFSNILFDLNSQIARLIDPRGSFGTVGIYGDPRYDMAKLSHSLNGNYDFIVSDQFSIETDGEAYQFHISEHPRREYLTSIFDEKLMDLGYDPQEVHFIEALLFLSMLPLHNDKPQRQRAMYFTGIIQLNKLYENRN